SLYCSAPIIPASRTRLPVSSRTRCCWAFSSARGHSSRPVEPLQQNETCRAQTHEQRGRGCGGGNRRLESGRDGGLIRRRRDEIGRPPQRFRRNRTRFHFQGLKTFRTRSRKQ